MAYEMVMPYHLHMPSYFLETFTLRHSKATLLALKDKGQKQEDGNTVDFLWNTYGKCHTDDRKNQKQNS